MLLFMPPYCRCHSDMYDVIRLHYDRAVTSQLFWLAPLSDEILDVVTSKKLSLLQIFGVRCCDGCTKFTPNHFVLHVNGRMYSVVAPCMQDTLFVFISCEGKAEVHPRTGHEFQEGEMRYSSTLSLSSALDGGGQRHAPSTLSAGKDPVTTL
jgi:hypothetical protein